MTDIVDRLRDQQSKWMTPILDEAAIEIETLRKLSGHLLDDELNEAMGLLLEHPHLQELLKTVD